MEYAPYGGRQIRMTASEKRNMRRKIIRGGQIADQIRKKAQEFEAQELPLAEQKIERELAQNVSVEKVTPPAPIVRPLPKQKPSLWEKIKNFLKRLLLP